MIKIISKRTLSYNTTQTKKNIEYATRFFFKLSTSHFYILEIVDFFGLRSQSIMCEIKVC